MFYHDNPILNFFKKLFTDFNFKSEVFYVHNLNFDGYIIIDAIKDLYGLTIKTYMHNLKLFYLELNFGNKRIKILCSYKILPISLKKVAELLKSDRRGLVLPYKFISIQTLYYIGDAPGQKYFNSLDDYLEFSICFKNKKFDVKAYSIEYCLNNVYLTQEFITQIRGLCEVLFSIKITNHFSISSLSLEIFKKKFNPDKGVPFRSTSILDKIIRRSYFGGRCEVFGNQLTTETVLHFDFKGMYGQCMGEPISYRNPMICTVIEPINAVLTIPGFYLVTFESNLKVPVLPIRDALTGKLLFINGRNTGLYWWEEINLFLQQGGKLLELHFSITFSKTSPVLSKFSAFFNTLRNESRLLDKFGKLVINSFYGRCGLKSTNQVSIILLKKEYDLLKAGLTILEEKSINGVYFLKIALQKGTFKKINFKYSVNPKKIDNNVAIASAITSKARVKLYRTFLEINKLGGRLLYCDTDSIFVAFCNSKYRGMLNTQFGEVFFNSNKQDTIIIDSVFISSKSYALKYLNGTEIVKIKGFRAENLSLSELKTKFYLKGDSFSTVDSFSIKKEGRVLLKASYIKKIFKYSTYDKREFTNSKSTTEPIKRAGKPGGIRR